MREGWEIRKLKDVCTLINGRAYKKPELLSEGKYPVLRVGNLFTNNQWYYSDLELDKDKYCDNGDLIYAWSASFGPRIWEGGKVIYHYHIWKVLPDFKLVHKDFLFHLFEWDKEMIKSAHGTGTTMMHVGKSSMENRSVPIPPLTEQKQIVAILDKAFAAIDQAKANIEKNIENAKELFQSKLNEIFSQKGEGWEEMLLPELVEKTCSLSYGIVQPGEDYPNGIKVVRPTDMKKTFVEVNKLKRVHPDKVSSYGRTTLTGNELLLCVRGDTGLISLTTKELAGANVTRGIVPILFNNQLIRLNFGYYQFASKSLQKQIKQSTYGAALMQINIRDVKKLKLNIPALDVQDKLLPQLDKISQNTESILKFYSKKLFNLEDLKKSILQKAFAGELIKEETESILQMVAEPGTVYEK